MGEEFLTVKDFAEKAGVSVQSVYKKLGKVNNPIQRYLKVVDGVKYINCVALDVLYSAGSISKEEEVEQEIQKVEAVEEDKKIKSSYDRLLDILENQLEEQREQLKEKDKQIAEQAEQIKGLVARLAESNSIISNQQQLTAMNIKSISVDENNTASTQEEEAAQPQPKKRHFWSRFFRTGNE